jgi:hypothetical protein
MAADIAQDALGYIKWIGPLLLIFGAVSFADLTIGYLIKLMKQMPFAGKIKW